ncbi:hypothetical protein [Thermomonas flagellata]|uniref:hypothetical protein n=1 Tax=Thermomonas flagellata TaxID=2888524 RepID=UPI001F04610D|nr:hypothetical protein [Thermomonas flagellata]
MTTVQDKLAASLRRAKADPAAAPAPPPPAPARGARTSKRRAPASAEPAPRVHAGGIPDSSTALHPARVWPD